MQNFEKNCCGARLRAHWRIEQADEPSSPNNKNRTRDEEMNSFRQMAGLTYSTMAHSSPSGAVRLFVVWLLQAAHADNIFNSRSQG